MRKLLLALALGLLGASASAGDMQQSGLSPFLVSVSSPTNTAILTSTITDIFWVIEDTDTASGFDGTNSSNTITAVSAGYYAVTCHLTLRSGNSTQRTILQHNNLDVGIDYRDPVSGDQTSTAVTKTIRAQAGDTFRCRFRTNAAVGTGNYLDTDASSYFQAIKIHQ